MGDARRRSAPSCGQARHDAYFASLQLRPGSRAMSTDVCVPISRLTECIVETTQDIERASMPIPLVRPRRRRQLPLRDPDRPDSDADDSRRPKALNERLVERALAMDGTCTGEHGIGLGQDQVPPGKEHGEAST